MDANVCIYTSRSLFDALLRASVDWSTETVSLKSRTSNRLCMTVRAVTHSLLQQYKLDHSQARGSAVASNGRRGKTSPKLRCHHHDLTFDLSGGHGFHGVGNLLQVKELAIQRFDLT